MAPKLCEEEIVTPQVLRDKGLSFREIATTLGVSEGTVRSHRKRRGQPDGRGKPRKAQALADVIDAWMLQHAGCPDEAEHPRPVNVLVLYDWLRQEQHYQGSYRSVLRFVRDRYPQPRLRPYRRVETPPGAHYG
jgi:hypothetical protein